MSQPKLRILCLHGYRQNGDVFRMKTGSLRKMLKNHAELHYITAPHLIPLTSPNETSEECVTDQRSWWFTSEEQSYNSKEYSDLCIGFEESVGCVETALREEGPFDGVLGFSQGASFLSLLCSFQQQGGMEGRFKFAMFFAGFKSRCGKHQDYYQEVITLPSLHVFGDTDAVIPKEMSEDLSKSFDSPVTVLHSGGHYVPASAPQKEKYVEFFQAIKQNIVNVL